MTDIVERGKTSEEYALNMGCVRELVAEIERLRDTLRITDPNNLLGRLQAAEADLAEAEALLREWVDDCCPWTQTEIWLARKRGE